MASFAFYGPIFLIAHGKTVLKQYCFIHFEASTFTAKPLLLITYYMICCCLNSWNQPLEHWNLIPIFNAISFTFSLTLRST